MTARLLPCRRLWFCVVVASLLCSGPAWAAAKVVRKDSAGNVQSSSLPAISYLRDQISVHGRVRVCVTINAPNDNYLTDTPEYRRQAQRVEVVRIQTLNRLRRAAPSTEQYEPLKVGPYFWVAVDDAGLDYLIADRIVIQFFAPSPHDY
jgi:hypothetical protein